MHGHRPISTIFVVLGAAWHTLTGLKVYLSIAMGQWRWTMKHARKGTTLLTDPWTHFRVAGALSRRVLRPILNAAPLMMFKYLTDYLKTDLTREERAALLVHHYTMLGDRASEEFFHKIVGDGLVLWRAPAGETAYSIDLTFPRDTHHEGDLALIFRNGATGLYTLSFTIGPGSLAKLDAANVMYVARVQGKGGSLDQIRRATKDCLDISPSALLLAAAEGIAMELNLERIIGISANTQLSVGKSRPGGLVAAYDDFWLAVGGEKVDRDMYQLTVPLTAKPLQSVKRCHRSRVRRKRAFKRLVRDRVRSTFRACMSTDAADAA